MSEQRSVPCPQCGELGDLTEMDRREFMKGERGGGGFRRRLAGLGHAATLSRPSKRKQKPRGDGSNRLAR